MSKDFYVIPFERMFEMMLQQVDAGEFMGIQSGLFARKLNEKLETTRFGQQLASPIGVAAGPHSQLSQNIVAAWLCGARYIELKTVQTLDELNVSKPCIDMQDEGYNCEWSQELKIHESFNQYLDAWIMIHVLNHKLYNQQNPGAGAIFNMSVGYNLEGILKDNVQWFFSKMENCEAELQAKIDSVKHLYPAIDRLNIPSQISDNITLSTMHGCPPDEIENIGLYLIRDKKLHTTIKLNPTLLGAEMLREILNDKLGFKTVVPDEAFAHDLKYNDALSIIRNLQQAATESGVFFGLKLTNTLESMNIKGIFPENEKMNYMSGRALHSISVHLAEKLQSEFDGLLDVSFSAGADAFNISDLLSCGLSPVTVSSDILKPGGYGRLSQYIEKIEEALSSSTVENLSAFICAPNQERVGRLQKYAAQTLDNEAYRKHIREPSIKTSRKLGLFDCIHAPCVNTCPTNQNIPQYLYHVANGEFQKAYEEIMKTNPFPNVTGTVCDHECQTRCTRINYDENIAIREVKRWVSELENDDSFIKSLSQNGLKAAIIGGGPSGMSAAYFLLLAGFQVDVYEEKSFAGGMVADVIPAFRLKNEAIQKDISRIEKLGASMHYNTKIGKSEFEALHKEGNYIFIATGAPETKKLGIAGDTLPQVLDPLDFLSRLKKGNAVLPGKHVLVIGGGNTAMDVARASKKLLGKDGTVTVVYRRKTSDMPAETEEILAAVSEEIKFLDLRAPLEVVEQDGKVVGLKTIRMKVAGIDSTGRSKIETVKNSEEIIEADVVFAAIGQNAVLDFIAAENILIDSSTYETKLERVYIGGDVRKGPANIISAVADGRKAASAIIQDAGKVVPSIIEEKPRNSNIKDLLLKKGRREKSQLTNEIVGVPSKNIRNANQAVAEASRCLLCDEICNICVTVCPNLANRGYNTEPFSAAIYTATQSLEGIAWNETGVFTITQSHQTYNIGEFCNECGNCNTFCPTAGAPYKDKPQLWLTADAFEHANSGYHFTEEKGNRTLLYKTEQGIDKLMQTTEGFEFSNEKVVAKFDVSLKPISIAFLDKTISEILLDEAVKMKVLFGI